MTTTNETMDRMLRNVGKAILIAPVWLAALVAGWAWYGYVLHLLWAWFMVPAFGAPPLAIPMALGVAATVGLLTKPSPEIKEDEPKWRPWAVMFIRPTLVLLVGWIVKQFI
jgi:hypothetical protein